MDIHHSSIKNFILPKVKSVYLIDYYGGIQSFLASREDFNFKDLLANPRVRTQNEIIWSTEAFTKKPVLLCNLSGHEKERYSYLLNQCIHSFEYLIEILTDEEGSQSVCELLSKSIPYVDDQSVYCGEGKVVLVNWGLIPRTQEQSEGQIYRSGRFVGNWDKKHQVPPAVEDALSFENVADSISVDCDDSSENVTSTVMETQDTIQKPIEEEGAQADNILVDNLSTAEIKVEQLEAQSTEVKEKENKKLMDSDKVTTLDNNNPDIKTVNGTSSNNLDNYGWKTLFVHFWQGIRFLFKKLLWLLILIALSFLIMFLCRDCQGPIHKINPYYNPLPENPIILPVEEAHVGKSADGKNMIATDRLNVILEQKDEHTMLEWAKAFKRIYDKDAYEVVYYNKELDLLQIRVPDDEREAIKHNLPNELSQFSFEIFDECIQESGSVEINDPMYGNPYHSWYFNPIGAPNAWDITLGEKDVVIAIIDNGFDATHPEFVGKLYNSYNVLTRNAYLYPITTNNGVNAHGTHVAATAAGNYNNASGLLGIAPNCRLMLIQVGNDNPQGYMSTTAIRDGVLYAISQGVDVINLSLGIVVPDYLKAMNEGAQLNYIANNDRQEELLWQKVYDKAKKKNCTIVFAAGNDNVLAGIDPQKRSKDIIKVSAINMQLQKADFSNYGVYPRLNREYSTVSAPGVSIYSAAPDGQYESKNGTSMAAPIVSGAVALLKSVDKNLTTDQIITLFKKTGDHIDPKIGPMINIGRALQTLKGDTVVDDKCEKIKQEVTLLRAKIDSLVQICPDAAEPSDTLKYDDAINGKHGLDGVWKSSTELVSVEDETPIELYMSFRKLKGTLTIINKGVTYTAKLNAKIKKGKISIVQDGPATDGKNSFLPYEYECISDKKGYFQCTATSDENKVIFNLIRIK